MANETVQVKLNLPRKLHKKVKHHCKRLNMTQQKALIWAVGIWITDQEQMEADDLQGMLEVPASDHITTKNEPTPNETLGTVDSVPVGDITTRPALDELKIPEVPLGELSEAATDQIDSWELNGSELRILDEYHARGTE